THTFTCRPLLLFHHALAGFVTQRVAGRGGWGLGVVGHGRRFLSSVVFLGASVRFPVGLRVCALP
ncbi:MAG: hypothetical protein K6T61_18065, partial [Bryobacteraceae bacterium]|nr:hypothetical protein [Bryobacteraceae bacterium]